MGLGGWFLEVPFGVAFGVKDLALEEEGVVSVVEARRRAVLWSRARWWPGRGFERSIRRNMGRK